MIYLKYFREKVRSRNKEFFFSFFFIAFQVAFHHSKYGDDLQIFKKDFLGFFLYFILIQCIFKLYRYQTIKKKIIIRTIKILINQDITYNFSQVFWRFFSKNKDFTRISQHFVVRYFTTFHIYYNLCCNTTLITFVVIVFFFFYNDKWFKDKFVSFFNKQEVNKKNSKLSFLIIPIIRLMLFTLIYLFI